jgi:hypothetical protein
MAMPMTLFGLDLTSLQPYFFYAAGCGLATAFVLFLTGTNRKSTATINPPVTGPLDPPVDWESHDPSFADRRSSIRRNGKPVRIFVLSPLFGEKIESGWVLDRSTGGLRVAMITAVAPGKALQVRAKNAPNTIPWVTVIVRSCRNNGEFFELGCEFEKTPPWHILLLFG